MKILKKSPSGGWDIPAMGEPMVVAMPLVIVSRLKALVRRCRPSKSQSTTDVNDIHVAAQQRKTIT